MPLKYIDHQGVTVGPHSEMRLFLALSISYRGKSMNYVTSESETITDANESTIKAAGALLAALLVVSGSACYFAAALTTNSAWLVN